MEERWVQVAVAPDESSALLMEGLLKNAGIPSLTQRARGFDGRLVSPGPAARSECAPRATPLSPLGSAPQAA